MLRISIRNLSIRFRHPADRTKTIKAKMQGLVRRFAGHSKPRYFDALSDVDLDVHDGDVIGFVGPNGSGKTTLLRAISGIYLPDTGSVEVNGRVSALLSLGTGFNKNLDGIENIRLNALLMGMTPDEIENRIPEIIKFADIGEHIYSPVKYYSTGMTSRLSFSIVLAMRPEILLIDEIFSVGDLAFKQKSRKAMDDMLGNAACQLMVTHSLPQVREGCNRAVYLKGGRIVADGPPDEVVDLYESENAPKT